MRKESDRVIIVWSESTSCGVDWRLLREYDEMRREDEAKEQLHHYYSNSFLGQRPGTGWDD